MNKLSRFGYFLGLLAAVIGSPTIEGQSAKRSPKDKLQLTMRVASADPFHDSNEFGKPTPKVMVVAPGDVLEVEYSGKLDSDAYTYSITDKGTPPVFRYKSANGAKKLFLKDGLPVLPLLPVQEFATVKHHSDTFGAIEKITTPFTWKQEVVVAPDTKPGDYMLTSALWLQVCDKTCWQGDWSDLVVPIKVEGSPKELSAALQARIDTSKLAPKPEPPRVVAPPSGFGEGIPNGTILGRFEDGQINQGDLPRFIKMLKQPLENPTMVAEPSDSVSQSAARGGLWALLVKAFLGAFLMLLTPCVFPMIPITVNFFLKQAEKEHHRPLPMALVYSFTIITVLSLAIFFLGSTIINLANDAWFNLVLGLVMIWFALSLFGMYEIELPSFLSRFTSSREGKGGLEGTIFMALTFTITSFTCTGPFLGLMLAMIATSDPSQSKSTWELGLAALVYSSTFAAPFFLLALFPSFLKKLPKSGGWLNTVKVSMGFLEFAFALKFLANTDIAWFPGDPVLFNYDTVLVAWIVLSFACGLYLLGFFRLPHDDPAESTGVIRMLFGVVMFGLAVYMVPFLFGGKPRGAVANGIIAFLPPDLKHQKHHLDYEDAYKEAVAKNKLLFIDFTGVNCSNCRYNEQNVFTQPEVAALLNQYVIVQLYTDRVPKLGLSVDEAKDLAYKYAGWRRALSGGVETNPYYLVFRPDPLVPLKQ